ncbi:methyltetrahydrofolate cobalamin methyltransferase [Desulfosporosinus sp.]|uniref:methyltetrahydrofolate cobalamin methyltransferase n=1 Tax=Desulfosporosinus sp. TaxID=157907 RepID=UPI0025BA2E94|nr:methyltetrahydrofolate cobalamin methyltransferase [Desulfosporosinus sp.]MBC2721671.1 methyltetrahydrofolate cobalamin methyltransferase [Desulfosporosinus sp.]MBC2725953.1 methyltetrahydrofolate cobalamin methyltransferase [Desulfosporosinus sp.]
MLIIGELINTSRKLISEAVEKKDADYIKRIAIDQVEAGANYIDINCGTMIFDEVETMEWLVNTVQEVVQVPLCIDSPNPKAIEAGLKIARNSNGKPLINSITGENERYSEILPLVLNYKTKVVALCMDDNGMPETAEDRMAVAQNLYQRLIEAGVSEDDIYFDPLVKPVSTGDKAGLEVLDTIKLIKENYPNVHMVCGLSNVSFGLPNRKVLNQLFMIQTMTMGMDSYILNPLDKSMMGAVQGSQTLLGKDSYCTGYLNAHRKRLYE